MTKVNAPGRTIAAAAIPLALALIAAANCAPRARPAEPALPVGLWDAHTHVGWWGADALDSLYKYGIVGVRDLGSDAYQLAAWREQIARGERKGPLILYAGGQIDGPKRNTQWRTIVTTEAEARRAVDSLADLGVSFIKVHSKLSPPLFFVVLRQARVRGLRVAAHLPEGVPAWMAADSGVGSLEHMAESILVSPMYAGYVTTLEEAIEWWSSPAGDTMIVHLARTGVAVTPTLAAYQEFARERDADEESRVGRAWVLEFQKWLTLRFYRAGISILAGSDFGAKEKMMVPGSILFEEIRLLEEAGLPPAAARAAASTNIMEWLSDVSENRRPPGS